MCGPQSRAHGSQTTASFVWWKPAADRHRGSRKDGAPPPAPPSQASAASQPFVYDLAGSSSDEEDGGDAKRARLSEESSRSLPSSFFCAISHSVMRDPVVCADGMTYERAYIESWLLAHDTSPLTNQPLAHKLLVPNIALKQAIGEMLERV